MVDNPCLGLHGHHSRRIAKLPVGRRHAIIELVGRLKGSTHSGFFKVGIGAEFLKNTRASNGA